MITTNDKLTAKITSIKIIKIFETTLQRQLNQLLYIKTKRYNIFSKYLETNKI